MEAGGNFQENVERLCLVQTRKLWAEVGGNGCFIQRTREKEECHI